MKIAIILGTRPEIIKMSPIIRECERIDLDYFLLHTGQHYSYNMDKVFFDQLGLPGAKYNLDVGSGSHAEQTGKILMGIENVLLKELPDIVLVEGDTNSVLAGALAACKVGIEVGHVEAGLRSYDRRMPEEVNRVLADHCSDYLFAPTEKSVKILLDEGISKDKVFLTGNTVVDAIYQNIKISDKKVDSLEKYGLNKGEYFLTTVHRQENVDDKIIFSSIIRGLELVSQEFHIPVVYPVHPRAKKMMKKFRIDPNLLVIDAVDYLTFLLLEKNARLILSDSGGVQEEACVLGVPCVTLRENTERPETVDVGSNIIAGTHHKDILNKVKYMLKKSRNWVNPFGDGFAGKKIVNILQQSQV